MDFIFNKDIRHYYSVQHEVKTGIEVTQPCLCWNRQVDQGREHRSGWGGVVVGRGGPVSPPPHIMLRGTQTHSDAAAERRVTGSEATKWDRASLSPHEVAVSHCERK